MASKIQKRREQKKVARKKRLNKERNLRVNGARFRYTLECRLNSDEPWKPMKRFKDSLAVQKHLDETEAIRKRGDTEIIEGRVIDNNHLFKVVATVKSFMPELGPSMEEAAKDIRKAVESQAIEAAKENFENSLGNVGLDTISVQNESEPQPEDANAEVS